MTLTVLPVFLAQASAPFLHCSPPWPVDSQAKATVTPAAAAALWAAHAAAAKAAVTIALLI
jgi:hypothetical protein